MRLALAVAGFCLAAFPVCAFGPEISASPMPRPASMTVETSVSNAAFQRWLDGFRTRATGQGIDPAVLDSAFTDMRYMTGVIEKDRNQSEFTKQIWVYLETAVSDARVRNGQAALAEHAALLDRIEERYGVEAQVVTAVWGLESAYGSFRGSTPVIPALATLAFDGRRGDFFEAQLVAALQIVQSGDTAPARMTGSWAGAMGHTQFMPTSYLDHAQDFTGDGRRDIWSDDPADALASTAAYLAHFGWTRGQPWGLEVRLPDGFDFAQSGERIKKPVAAWLEQGVRDASGASIPHHGQASILLPAGARGAAFMIFDNFHVLERYNTADAYVIGVGHLSDRIAGGPPLRASWPVDDRNLRFAEKQEMQERLTQAGFDTEGVDGIIGPNTIQAIREYQASIGLIPDGYASYDILRRLR